MALTTQYALEHLIREYVTRTVTPDMLRAAMEWHDGAKSAMRRFYFSQGHLSEPGDYRKLAKEVREARLEINEDYAQWRKPLTELELWAARVQELQTSIGQFQGQIRKLLAAGLEASEVTWLSRTAVDVSA